MKNSLRLRGVVFDMDGVMFDTERLAVDGWVYAGKEAGYPITEAMMIETLGIDSKGSVAILRRHLGEAFDFWAVRPHKTRYTEEYIARHGLPVKPGLRELLRTLTERGYLTAVASSTAVADVRANLAATGVSAFFRAVVGGDMIEHGKPAPDIYLAACEKLGLLPEECAAIEDSPAGLRSAHSAGLRVIMIPDLVEPGKSIEDIPYTLLRSLGEVPGYLEHLS